ncbi:glycosyltransferase [Wenyingzhuangia aestuarii]|uniref:glycosyltransferase n=1 Tax=Wenyingzhuangia aestuarii TaxID=1647582 RepID=UPI001438B08B|nr:glycosyltransferase [Wenyingzhuangia aestuarii]NJB81736.1 hypothetical protein [Wenyingzhuangia aestuarii]
MLAIVIPYFKLTFFEETIQSLVNQKNKIFTVYIGNDASPECPKELLDKYKNELNFKYKKFPANLGGSSLVKQWDRCIDLIEDEEWIMILGDDDILGENVVAEFYKNIKEIEKQNINVVRYATNKINEKNDITSILYQHPVIEKSTDFIFRSSRSSLSEYIFKKEQISKVKFKEFPLAWYSDILAVLEFSNFKNVYSITNAIVYVRISDISISGQQNNQEDKNNARFKYYYYLLKKKNVFFSKAQNVLLLNMLNKTYINNKKNVFFLLKALYIHISVFYFFYIIHFFRDIIKSIKTRN